MPDIFVRTLYVYVVPTSVTRMENVQSVEKNVGEEKCARMSV
jgi:hypothetical protein